MGVCRPAPSGCAGTAADREPPGNTTSGYWTRRVVRQASMAARPVLVGAKPVCPNCNPTRQRGPHFAPARPSQARRVTRLARLTGKVQLKLPQSYPLQTLLSGGTICETSGIQGTLIKTLDNPRIVVAICTRTACR